ncbi:unnamed protein product [Moneuplotes crassus]|uniref:Ubiquitin-like domain-containing protein n=1 Tax=Euplotes crassus TaxID=5936 RepID=A0AAD2D875_EUPCR|nr:unnamed protein product [Moneuplotes crassus]
MEETSINVNVKTAEGVLYVIVALLTDKLQDLKMKIDDKVGVRPEHQKLAFKGKTLRDNNKTLQELGFSEKCTVHFMAVLRGGKSSFSLF